MRGSECEFTSFLSNEWRQDKRSWSLTEWTLRVSSESMYWLSTFEVQTRLSIIEPSSLRFLEGNSVFEIACSIFPYFFCFLHSEGGRCPNKYLIVISLSLHCVYLLKWTFHIHGLNQHQIASFAMPLMMENRHFSSLIPKIRLCQMSHVLSNYISSLYDTEATTLHRGIDSQRHCYLVA